MYLVLLVPFALYLPFLYHQARFYFDLGPIAGLGIGLTTMGLMFVAIGLFFSVLTRNQILAAIWTFVVLFLMVVLSLLLYYYAVRQQSTWAESARFVSVLLCRSGVTSTRPRSRHVRCRASTSRGSSTT
jgi:ABC-2 type transport system permease protein